MKKETELWFKEAEELGNQGQFKEAIDIYDNVLKVEPNNTKALYHKACALNDLGLNEEALLCLYQAIEINDNDASIWNCTGYVLDALGRYEEAIKKYDKAIMIDPNFEKAWCNKGVTLCKLDKYKEAIECCDKMLTINSLNSTWGNVASIMAIQKKDEEFLFLCDLVLKYNSEVPLAWYLKGLLLSENGNFDEAINCFDQSVAIDIDYKEAWIHKGISLCKLGKFDEAINCFDHALNIDPEDKEIWKMKAAAFGGLQRYEEGIDCYDKALTIDPTDASAWNRKSGLLNCLEQFEEAIRSNDHAITLNPHDAETWANRGNLLWRLEQREEAVNCFSNSIRINPDFALAWWYKGCCLGELDKNEEAIDCFEKALKINPEMYEAEKSKLIVLHKLGRIGDPTLSLLMIDLAHNERQHRDMFGSKKEDVEYYDRLLAKDPNNAGLWANKGSILTRMGKYKETIDSYNKALKLEPSMSWPIYDNLNRIFPYRIKQLIEQNNFEGAVSEIHKFKSTLIFEKPIETIDIIHFFSNEIKQEITSEGDITPYTNFTITWTKIKDDYFRKTINPNRKDKDTYAKLYMLSLLIVDMLHVTNDNVAHYTTPTTAKLLLGGQNKASHFRLNDAKSGNDETECDTLLKYLFEKDEADHPKDSDITFIGCFTFDSNSLNQFRLYGKVDEREATGISIEVKPNYFESDRTMLITLPLTDKFDVSSNKQTDLRKLSLYRCIYLDPETGVVESVAHIEETTATRDKKAYDRNMLESIKKDVRNLLVRIKKFVSVLDKNKVIPLLENLNVLVKFYGYKEEQECRVVKILARDDSEVKFNDKNIPFIDYIPMPEYVRRITLPPKSTDDEEFVKLLRRAHIKAIVEISKHPFRRKQ